MSTNPSHLAGEFLVAGELSRRGYSVSITMGNAKSVDIFVEIESGKPPLKVDAKASQQKGNWPIKLDSIKNDVWYIFVYLQTKNQINEGLPPEYFIASGAELKNQQLVDSWAGGTQGVRYKAINNDRFKSRWDKLIVVD